MDVTEEQLQRFNRLVPWGMRGKIVSALIDLVLDVVEEFGLAALGAILSGDVTILDLIRMKRKGSEDGNDTELEK